MAERSTIVRMFEQQYGPFTHMAELDVAIWVRWLANGGGVWAPFEYDVRVGQGVTLPAAATAFTQDMAYYLTTKRIDVVATIQGVRTVIEVKQRAGLGAIGQMIGYQHLYSQDHPEYDHVAKLLVTDILQPDMLPLLLAQGIACDQVGV